MSAREAIRPLAVPVILTLYTILMLSLTPVVARVLITYLRLGIIAWVVMTVFVGVWLYSLYKLTVMLRNRFIGIEE